MDEIVDNKIQGNVRITSDGSLYGGTHVMLPDGQKLKNVRCITWVHKAGDVPVVTIEVMFPELDVTCINSASVHYSKLSLPE